MKGIASEDLIAELKEITEANRELVLKKCIHLGENQLIWRPSNDSWNIREVLSHINALAAYYHPNLIRKIKHTKHKKTVELFTSSHLGKSTWKSMKLGRANNIKRKFRASKNSNPTINPDLIDTNSIENFEKNQIELLDILEKAKNVNLRKIRLQTSVSKLVRLRLGDVLMFVVYHNERHIQQIKNIMEHRNFPKKERI